PIVTIIQPTGNLLTNQNFWVLGQVADNLSGVRNLTGWLDPEDAVTGARQDLARRLQTSIDSISLVGIARRDFGDTSLGAPIDGQLYAQVITKGYSIQLRQGQIVYDYRTTSLVETTGLRLVDFQGRNWEIPFVSTRFDVPFDAMGNFVFLTTLPL